MKKTIPLPFSVVVSDSKGNQKFRKKFIDKREAKRFRYFLLLANTSIGVKGLHYKTVDDSRKSTDRKILKEVEALRREMKRYGQSSILRQRKVARD